MAEDFSLEQKKVKNTKIPPAIAKKTLHELILMFLQCFCANMYSLSASNVHGWIRRNQLCSELNHYFSEMMQRKSVIFRADSVLFRIHQSQFDGAE